MKSKHNKWFPVAAVLVAILSATPANAIRAPRIELLREVTVSGAAVALSDLLPASAGDSLRAQAGEISLGAAPQPGNTRVIGRGGILNEMAGKRDLFEAIEIPERVTVSRDARPIALEEVFAAIQRALAQVNAPAAKNLSPENILLESQILVKAGDAGLQVLRSDFDSGMKRVRFLLWPSRDPTVLPFYVTAVLPEYSGSAVITDIKRSAISLNDRGAARTPARSPKPEILVSPNASATLLLTSATLNMIVDVTPLERGTLGQKVRVRVADTGKVFRAEVDGRAHLEMKF
jgi:hypothetical protein